MSLPAFQSNCEQAIGQCPACGDRAYAPANYCGTCLSFYDEYQQREIAKPHRVDFGGMLFERQPGRVRVQQNQAASRLDWLIGISLAVVMYGFIIWSVFRPR